MLWEDDMINVATITVLLNCSISYTRLMASKKEIVIVLCTQ
jgi:hypothetical protein